MDDMNFKNEHENITSGISQVNNQVNDSDSLRSSSFYSESCKRPARKGYGIMQLIAVALISSILGGVFTGAFFQFGAPILKTSMQGYFDKVLPGNAGSQQKDALGVKKVEIIQSSDSPVSVIAEKVSPSIVGIRTTFKAQNFFFGDTNTGGEGSGIIIKSNGYIMTNNHVIEGAVGKNGSLNNGAKIEVILPNQKEKPYQATVVGRDVQTDLAVIKIDASELPAAELGNSDELKVGELAVAIGNPAGLEYMGSVTAGIISGLNRTIPLEENKQLKLIQTDAAINPGNSGGALVNSRGQVIGINTMKMGGQGFEGLGFAIPMNKAKEIVDNLIEFKYVKGRPAIGIGAATNFTEEYAKRLNVPSGVLVSEVFPMSGAFKAGIQRGDIITKFAGQQVKTLTELNDIKNTYKPGDTLDIEVYRDGNTKALKLILGEDTGN